MLVQDSTRLPEIVLVTASLSVGGTERQIVDLASSLHERGWGVLVYSFADGRFSSELRARGVAVIVSPLQAEWSRFPKMRMFIRRGAIAAHLLKILLKRRPSIVQFFLPEAYLIGTPLAVVARIPVRIMSRRSLNLYQQKYGAPAAWIERRFHRLMTAVLGNSRKVSIELRDQEDVPVEKIGLIYNGVDLDRIVHDDVSTLRTALGISSASLVLVSVANLIPYKGHRDLIEGVASVASKLPSGWVLLLVGRDGGLGNELRRVVANYGLDRHVLFLGERSDISVILAASDIGILCSHQEGFSNAILEMMAAGLPVVATDAGGNAEAIIDGECGVIVPISQPTALARALLRLANEPTFRQKMGAAASKRVVEHFSKEQCIERYDALYRVLLNGGMPSDLPQIRLND